MKRFPSVNTCFVSGVVDASMVAHRPREATYPMISVDEAVQMVMSEADVMDVEKLSLSGRTDFIICIRNNTFLCTWVLCAHLWRADQALE